MGLEKGVLEVGEEPHWLGDGRRSGFWTVKWERENNVISARNGTFDSCTLTSGSELWLFLLSVDVTHSCVQSISGDLGDSVCVCLREPKPGLNSKALRGKSVDVRTGITVVSEPEETKCDVNGLHSMAERWTTLKKDGAEKKRMCVTPEGMQ